MISAAMLEVLACPRCESRPAIEQQGTFLVCTECRWGYRIVDGIPNMLAEEAVDPETWKTQLEKVNG